MAIELYWGSGSPFAWRVMLTLEERGSPTNPNFWSSPSSEHKTPELSCSSIPVAKSRRSKTVTSLSMSRWR